MSKHECRRCDWNDNVFVCPMHGWSGESMSNTTGLDTYIYKISTPKWKQLADLQALNDTGNGSKL